MKTKLFVLFAVSMTVSVSGCSKSSPCEQAESKLRSCGLLSKGSSTCQNNELNDCELGCLKRASCTQLNDTLCGEESGPVSTCVFSCASGPSSQARDCGDGGKYSESDRCDGFDDCDNAADELGCPVFACKSGEKIPETEKCDGFGDCDDGSDELGCPVFNCKNGEKIPEDGKCDGFDDCSDASDELGCPESAELICK